MAGNEIQAADSSEETQPEEQPQPQTKAKLNKAKAKGPKLNERGVPITQWDNPDLDPNKRKHIGESPDGKANVAK